MIKGLSKISVYIPLSLAAILLYQNCAPSGPANTIQTAQPSTVVAGSEIRGAWAGPCVDIGRFGGPPDFLVRTELRFDENGAGTFRQVETVFRKYDDLGNSFGECTSQAARRNIFEARGRYTLRPVFNGVYEIDYSFNNQRDGQVLQPSPAPSPAIQADAQANAASCNGTIGRVSQG